jgi:hypothetical protein
MVDEMHIVHAGRAGRHARQARETSVDVFDGIGGDAFGIREHVFDQVDPAARTVELVAEQDIGRAGCGAEPTMSAGPQYLF